MPDKNDIKYWVRNKHGKVFGADLTKRDATKLADEIRRKGSSGSPDGDRTAVAEPQPANAAELAQRAAGAPLAVDPPPAPSRDLRREASGQFVGDVSALDMLDQAWGLIANAFGGDWSKASPEWRAAAARWRDRWLVGAEATTASSTTPPAPPAPAPTNGVAPDLDDGDIDDIVEDVASLT